MVDNITKMKKIDCTLICEQMFKKKLKKKSKNQQQKPEKDKQNIFKKKILNRES